MTFEESSNATPSRRHRPASVVARFSRPRRATWLDQNEGGSRFYKVRLWIHSRRKLVSAVYNLLFVAAYIGLGVIATVFEYRQVPCKWREWAELQQVNLTELTSLQVVRAIIPAGEPARTGGWHQMGMRLSARCVRISQTFTFPISAYRTRSHYYS